MLNHSSWNIDKVHILNKLKKPLEIKITFKPFGRAKLFRLPVIKFCKGSASRFLRLCVILYNITLIILHLLYSCNWLLCIMFLKLYMMLYFLKGFGKQRYHWDYYWSALFIGRAHNCDNECHHWCHGNANYHHGNMRCSRTDFCCWMESRYSGVS